MITSQQIHWAAGFLEGEGWFGIGRKKASSLSIVVTQVQLEPLERLKFFFGGFIVKRSKDKNPNASQSYQWRVSGLTAVGLMMSIYKIMSPKRKQRILSLLSGWRISTIYPRYRTKCPRGHPYDGLNNRGARICLGCEKTKKQRFAQRQLIVPDP